jgi:hypothetical protein
MLGLEFERSIDSAPGFPMRAPLAFAVTLSNVAFPLLLANVGCGVADGRSECVQNQQDLPCTDRQSSACNAADGCMTRC